MKGKIQLFFAKLRLHKKGVKAALKWFPKHCRSDLRAVLRAFPEIRRDRVTFLQAFDAIEYRLREETVQIPYRTYFSEVDEQKMQSLSVAQKKILYCLYTRHHDGRLRERYIKALLQFELSEWEIPYLVKLCDEYVLEIIETIYESIKERDNSDLKAFCVRNQEQLRKSYARMTSYWNAYYRDRQLSQYVGKKVFAECFGYCKFSGNVRP